MDNLGEGGVRLARLLQESAQAWAVSVHCIFAVLLAVVSCTMGCKTYVKASRYSSWVERTVLWSCVVWPSGMGKSQVFDGFMEGVKEMTGE